MKQQKSFRSAVLTWALLTVPVFGAAAVLACAYEDGMTVIDLVGRFSNLAERPFTMHWTAHTPIFLLGALVLYAFAVALYYSARENRRPGEEHGSAKWGDPRQLGKKYRDKAQPEANIILTQNVQMGLDGRRHRRNLNILVVGGSGAGKTRFFVKPNIMQASNKPGVGVSYLVTDPKGEVVRALAPFLMRQGYDVQVFDLIDPARSDFYNPFVYLRDDKDVLKLITNLIKNTTPKNAQQQDPFWEKSEIALDSALILYLMHEAPPEEQNFETVMYMIENGGAREDDDDFQSPLDLLFEALEEEEPNHIAVKQYKVFKQAAGKTAKSILISCGARLAPFDIPQLREIMSYDELELDRMGDRKTATFFIISDMDMTYNFIVALAFTQMFNLLCERADNKYSGRLPHHVRVLWDEAANTGQVPQLEKLVAVIRSREISLCLFLQAQSQLKALYKDHAETIMGNMDSVIFLGGREHTTVKELSEALGKETISMYTESRTRGNQESHGQNLQRLGKELMTPDEVRAMDNEYALLFIRGERPVMDKKYDILKHPNLKYTEDGGAEPYVHTPCPDYTINDLDFAVDSLDELEILDETEIDL